MRNHIIAASIVALAITGCANMTETQKGTAKGAGIGAGVGAVVGGIAGGGRGVAIGAGVGAAAGAIGGNIWSRRMEEQKKQMEEASQGTGVEVSQTADNQLKLEIPSDISFDTNSAAIKPDFRPILDKFAATLNDNPNTLVKIVGHTDSSGTDAINDPLSVKRAASTRDYLINRGPDANRFTIAGRGSREPIAANDTPANRAKNRRVEIFVAEPAPPSAQQQ